MSARTPSSTVALPTGLLDRPDRLKLAGIALASLGSAGLELAAVAFIYPLVRVIGGNDAGLPASWSPSLAPVLGTHALPVLAVTAFFALILLKSVYNYLLLRWQEYWFQQVSLRLSARLIARYMAAPWSEHLARNSAEMIATVDSAAAAPLVSSLRGRVTLVTEGCVLTGVLVIFLFTAPISTIVLIVTLGLVLVPIARFSSHRLNALSREGAIVVGERIRLIRQALGAIKELRLLGRASYFAESYLAARQRDGVVQRRVSLALNVPRLVLEPAIAGAWMLVLVSILVFRPQDFGDAMAILGVFAVGALRLMPSLTRILSSAASLRVNAVAVRSIADDLAGEPPQPAEPAGASLDGWRSVALDAVGFTYTGSNRPAVDAIALTLERGQSIGLVGSSGAGKSTLADILLGLLNPTAGRLLVDGSDVSANLACWQRQIGYVPQQVSLIDASIRENIAFGVPPAEIDGARIERVAAQVQLGTLLAAAPRGLDTIIGEDGVRLSGGERQRIGLARALYDGRKLLVLDEATSALDRRTEAAITRTIAALGDDYAILIISHRVSAIRHCDSVVVLDEGRIVDRGPFDALTARGSFEG